jgi:hypothetical protein
MPEVITLDSQARELDGVLASVANFALVEPPTLIVDPEMGDDGSSLVDTQRKLMKVSEELVAEMEAHKAEREAHEKTRAAERTARAELEIFMKADVPTAKRLMELESQILNEKRERELLQMWQLAVRQKHNELEELHWKRSLTQTSFDAEGWRDWLYQISAAVKSLVFEFRHA